jgi:MYXO-CTERM domain-containing protein
MTKTWWRVFGVVCVMSVSAWADVPGPRTICIAPDGCVACDAFDDTCIAQAQDAGLVLSDCVSNRGVPQKYVCPPGHPAVASCGCGTTPAVGALVLAALALVTRRRR